MNSFVFYRSFYEATRMLPPEIYKEAMNGMLAYVFDQEDPEFENTMAEIVFIMAKPQIDANLQRRANGGKGGRPKTNGYKVEKPMVIESENHRLSSEKPNVNVNDNVNVNVNDNGVYIEPNGFTPPTKDNVIGYCQEVGISIDVDRFIDHYASVGWMSGSNKVTDWKAKVRNWARSDEKELKQGVRGRRQQAHNFKGRELDFDALEKEAMNDRK